MNNKLREGFTFTAIGTYSNFFIQIIVQAILSRLLSPKQYFDGSSISHFLKKLRGKYSFE
ncbi:hypothetical protein [Lactococcus lactis]|uniref:Uncharacterized protein n=1 Tax=Lactococcus lactis TaxID=1358 RepID=A0AAW8UDI5_9LACT|nr:hypothetical protein [Lactococcus lactis]MDT2882282.1 hypothetical protein [Lactococcus lactis]MDT2909871.1 hypothetical protein [Lactococcus lactis]MDT2946737.1 hypothetical protein [Lactococcus lactis]